VIRADSSHIWPAADVPGTEAVGSPGIGADIESKLLSQLILDKNCPDDLY
jgi:hypothetical protein